MLEEIYIYNYQNTPEIEEEEAVEYYAIRPNKTQIKKEIAEVFAMVEEICGLTESQIRSFELPDKIEDALFQALKMGHNAARKRLIKHITGQLREAELVEPAKERLARIKSRSVHAVREHHQAERLRDALLSDNSNEQLTYLLEDYPNADRQHIRQLLRNAQKEAKESKPPRSSRLLYQYLKTLIADSGAEDEQVFDDDADADEFDQVDAD